MANWCIYAHESVLQFSLNTMDTHKHFFLVATLALTWPLLTSCQSLILNETLVSLNRNITCKTVDLPSISKLTYFKMSLNYSSEISAESSEIAYFNYTFRKFSF